MGRQDAIEAERRGQLALSAKLFAECRPSQGAEPDERYKWANARAILAEREGDVELATRLYDEVSILFHRLQAPTDASIYGLSNAATWFANLGERARVRRLLDQFRAAAARQDNRGVSYEIPMIEATLAYAVDDLAGAERHWAAVMTAACEAGEVEKFGAIAEEQASVLVAMGKRNEAIALLRSTVPVDDTPFFELRDIPAAVALGMMLAGGSPSEAAEGFSVLRRALATEAARGMPEAEWRIFAGLAEAATVLGHTGTAIALGKQAVMTIASIDEGIASHFMRLSRDLDLRLRPYHALAKRLIEENRFPEAAAIHTMAKNETVFELARRDRDLDRRSKRIPFTPCEERWLGRYHVLRKELTKLQEIPAIEGADEVHLSLTESKHAVGRWLDEMPTGSVLAPSGTTLTSQARTTLPPNTVRLSYLLEGNGWHMLAETHQGGSAIHIDCEPAALAQDIYALREAVLARSSDWRDLSMRLYHCLIGPVESMLAGATRLEVSLAGAMVYLPLALLHDGTRYLVERVALASLTDIAAPSRMAKPRRDWHMAVMGAEAASPARLAHVHEELADILALCPAARRIAPFSADTLAGALADGAQLVHIASHFLLEPARPDRSHFLLDEGVLPLSALRTGKFDFSAVELLVLAACDTAVADGGQFGLESLAGLAQSKGARAVLGTLWPIDDAGAASFMHRFYAAAFTESPEVPLAEALRHAQLAAVGDGKGSRQGDPYSWAGYVLYE